MQTRRFEQLAAAEQTDVPEYLTTNEVSAWIRVSAATICRWRQAGYGPRVTWMGPSCPRYNRDDVKSWLERAAAA